MIFIEKVLARYSTFEKQKIPKFEESGQRWSACLACIRLCIQVQTWENDSHSQDDNTI